MEQAFRDCVAEARERGQTIFLSSHILSEVEALCDRVAILRDGVLVEIGTLAEMRHLSALTVEATFDGTVPDLSRVPGVTRVERDGHVVRLQVQGPVEPLLKALARPGCTRCSAASPRSRSCSSPTTAPAVMATDARAGAGGRRGTRRGAAPRTRHRAPAASGRFPGLLIARWTARRAARWGLVWGVVFGALHRQRRAHVLDELQDAGRSARDWCSSSARTSA